MLILPLLWAWGFQVGLEASVRPPSRQGLRPPLVLRRGLVRASSWASAPPSPPAADTTVRELSGAEVRWRSWSGRQCGGGVWMARSQPIVYTLTHYFTATSPRSLQDTKLFMHVSSLKFSLYTFHTLLSSPYVTYLKNTTRCLQRRKHIDRVASQ